MTDDRSPTEAKAHLAASVRAPRGRWLRAAWIALIVIAIYVLGIFAFSLTYPVQPGPFATDPRARANLIAAGLTPQQYDAIQRSLAIALAVVSYVVGLVLVWRRPMERMALFVAFLLIGSPLLAIENPTVEMLPAVLAGPTNALKLIEFACVAPFFYLFPNGRWTPRWARWMVLPWIGGFMLFVFGPPPGEPAPMWLNVVGWPIYIGWLANLVLFLLAPIYRYLRMSNAVERQQTKWLIVGVAGALVPSLLWGLLSTLFPAFAPNGSLLYVVGQGFIQIMFLFVPISIGIAILRYRLFDVDIIIRRTLIYGTLTALLAMIYFGSVIVFQQVFAPLFGTMNELTIVVSTLAIAALFHPLRRHVQAAVDRRFYRRKYNAAQTMQAFSLRLREETDLARISDDLVAVVQDTLQPVHVSLWLVEPAQHPIKRMS